LIDDVNGKKDPRDVCGSFQVGDGEGGDEEACFAIAGATREQTRGRVMMMMMMMMMMILCELSHWAKKWLGSLPDVIPVDQMIQVNRLT
jgi:hypothetical protein